MLWVITLRLLRGLGRLTIIQLKLCAESPFLFVFAEELIRGNLNTDESNVSMHEQISVRPLAYRSQSNNGVSGF